MRVTDFGVAVLDGDLLSSYVEQAGQLACADAWLQRFAPNIPNGGRVVDIGAALGDHAASYSRMVGETGEVVAFEPYAPFLECLRYNAAALPNVTVHGVALADTESRGHMHRSDVQPDNHGMSHLERDIAGETVVTTLDRVGAAWDRLDFVKIDVEGSEPLVIDGAHALLTKFHPALLVEVNAAALTRKGFSPDDVYRRLRALGYTCAPCRPGDTLTSPEIDVFCTYTPSSAPLGCGISATTSRNSGALRIHLLSVPNTQPTHDFPLDGFCVRTMLFAELCERLGHEVILYGVERSEAAGRFVQVMTAQQQQELIGGAQSPSYQYVKFDPGSPLFQSFNRDCQNIIRGTKQPGDVIATICGHAQMSIADAHPELTFLEYSVGYTGVAPHAHRVYQSNAWRHVIHGFTGVLGERACDAVIPPWFHAETFPVVLKPQPYVIYCGRLVASKGIATACDAAKAAGVELVLIGHGEPSLVTYGTYLGAVTTDERNRLLAHATACLMPTQYLEPFGNVAAEAQLCGTPIISTDTGGFLDSVDHGHTGFRCQSLGEFTQAITLAHTLDRAYIRARACALFSVESAERAYRAYFQRLHALNSVGWRDPSPTLILPERSEVYA